MERTVSEYMEMCGWAPTKFFIFSDNVFGNLVYYSHLLPLVVTLLLAGFIFFKNPKLQSTRWFLVTAILLSAWLFFDLILWATEKPEYTMFFWSIINMIEPMIYAGVLFFVYAFIDGKNTGFNNKLTVFVLLLPPIIFASTSLNLSYYDLTNCYREAIEGYLPYYNYAVEVVLSLWILILGMERYRKFQDNSEKNKAILATAGAVLFLLSFAMGNVIGSLLVDWVMGQYGLFGIPVFAAVLAYLIVKYHAFDTKVIGTQFLVAALWILTLGILFLRKIEMVQIVVLVTLFLFTILGWLLIRSVKREVKQREELAVANAGQENLIHIMNHQIKGYLTKARNIFAELKSEPDYCAGDAAKPMLDEGFKSLTEGVEFVQQVLQGSSASSGKLVYNLMLLDFNKLVAETVEKQRDSATAKSLSIDVKANAEPINIKADDIQLKEAVRNLIDNSIRYTETGGLTITVNKNIGKALLTVKDTGVGISDEDKTKLFQKGGRGKDSLKYNVNSTGYGLAFVKGVVEAHKGRVWAESAGPGKGSTFYMELPLA
jgi:signal transduction histidine kinase